MPRGITQEQVNEAADALLAEGERPTIERIRKRLGSGSPNNLARLFDGWWTTLSARLAAAQSVATAPDTVLALTRELWSAALAQARAVAAAELNAQRAELELRRDNLNSRVQSADAARTAAETELAQVRREMSHLERSLSDAVSARESLAGVLTDTRERLAATIDQHDAARADANALRERLEQERADALARERAQERHWVAEVDRARTETRRVRQALEVRVRELTKQVRKLEGERDAALARLHESTREQAGLNARCTQLERHVAQLLARPRPLSSAPTRRAATKARAKSKPMAARR